MDFVDVAQVSPGVVIDVKYASNDNFTGQVLYDDSRCFLRKGTALKLAKVQTELEKVGLGLKVWDGYRPLRVQKVMWQVVSDKRYVADPAVGSKHNRGAAVDVTLVKDGVELEMPTGFDAFCKKAHRDCVDVSDEARKNREILEMYMVGFEGLPHEWWHFNDVDWEMYDVVDFGFDML